MTNPGDLLWTPSAERKAATHLADFMAWLAERGQGFEDYDALWQWSVTHIEDFWAALWAYFHLERYATASYHQILDSHEMPGARWFAGARLNYARVTLAQGSGAGTAIHAVGEDRPMRTMSWEKLGADTRILATELRRMGIGPGDRVAAYLPNVPETTVAFLACAAVGAVWSSCSPDFGSDSVVDRFAQIEPRLLFATDGYRFGGKTFDRSETVRELIANLPSIRTVVHLPSAGHDGASLSPDAIAWDRLFEGPAVPEAAFEFADTDFSDPLWVVYSSGTTGPPKAFVHGHGGVVLEGMKFGKFQMDLGPESCLFFFTTTGWIMWNLLGYGLLNGASVLMVDGNPMAPQPDVLWQYGAQAGATLMGASPAFINQQIKLGIVPRERYDMSRVRAMVVSGAPMSPEQMQWCYDNVQKDLWLISTSGGTDIATGFLGGAATLPVYAGEMQTRCLGVDVHALNDAGEAVIDEVGELVVREPMPSMPLHFWGDRDFERYREAYFDVYPGWWRHGDFLHINTRGGCTIQGRSDSTLNRHGIRIGTAEIYRVLDDMDELADSIIVNLASPGGDFMPLFVTLPEGETLDDELRRHIAASLRSRYSPRHVPDRIIQAEGIPYTLTGKRMEVPLRKILMGAAPEEVASPDAMQNPQSLDFFVRYRDSLGEP